MNANKSADKATETLDSVSVITGVLTKLAALITGLSALAIISGWKKATTYYYALGAPWVTNMLSPSALLQLSAAQFLAIGICVFFVIYLLMQKSITEKKLQLYIIIFSLFTLLIFSILLLPTHWLNLSPYSIYNWNTGATLLITLAAGLSLGELIANMTEKKLQWNGYHIYILYLTLTFGLWQSAELNARAKAEYDGDLKSSELPVVSLVAPLAGKEWRLVTNIDSSFLVVSLAKTKEERVFRILSASEISGINSPSIK